LYFYDIKNKKALKINFKDFVIPMKTKSITTLSGKIYLIGGEKINHDKTTKYHR
jgi:hypothetical protein